MTIRFEPGQWALILGGSSGFGLATAQRLARAGLNIAVVHRDRRGAMAQIEQEFAVIRESQVGFVSFNLDALSEEGQKATLTELAGRLGEKDRVRLLLHSIAWGNLRPLVGGGEAGDGLADEDFARTIYSMGTSLLSWTRLLFERRLFAEDARIIGLTSEGSERVWPGYAAVSTAKAALEASARAIAVEYAPFGIRCNVLQPGVTDTPALRKIPGSAALAERAKVKNPFQRLTTPEDVADVVALMCTPEARWINGTIIRVDGGEFVVG